ncbi:MAG: DUF4062 domain-containing protein [Pirellula sp.]|jgi:hypothetical protein
MSKKQNKPITIMVSSTVYGSEDVLDRVYDLLTSFGYEVWMSHKGTLPVFSKKSAFENCLEGVRRCQIFLGIIGTRYGTGIKKQDPDSLSIVHQELRLAIELKKARWLLAHENILTARTLFSKLGYVGVEGRKSLTLKPSDVLEDKRLIDMYEEATFDRLPLDERKGNWVQKFHDYQDSGRYIIFQFRRYQEIEAYIREGFDAVPPFSELGGSS